MASSDSQPGTPKVGERTTATEWVVIAALVLVVIIGGITLLGERISGVTEPADAQVAE